MTEELKQLREALRRVKYEAVSLADAQVIALEALTAAQPAAQAGEAVKCAMRHTPVWKSGVSGLPYQESNFACKTCGYVGNHDMHPGCKKATKSAAQATPFPFAVVADPSIPLGQAVVKQAGQEVGRIVNIGAAQATPTQQAAGAPIKYQPGEWYEAKDRDDLESFFRSRLPAIRAAAREHGYAIGLHGSMRRDLDLIAAPWRDGASDKDVLAHAVAMAACGITRDGPYQWEQKPLGRVAASLSCCWPRWFNEAGAGHIDLSVVGLTHPAPGVPEGFALVPMTKAQVGRACKLALVSTPRSAESWIESGIRFAEEHHAAMLAAAQAKGDAHV